MAETGFTAPTRGLQGRAIGIKQLDLLGPMAQAEQLAEIPRLVFNRKASGTFTALDLPENQHGAYYTLGAIN